MGTIYSWRYRRLKSGWCRWHEGFREPRRRCAELGAALVEWLEAKWTERAVTRWLALMDERRESACSLAVGARCDGKRAASRGLRKWKLAQQISLRRNANRAVLSRALRVWMQSRLARGWRAWLGRKVERIRQCSLLRHAAAHFVHHRVGRGLRTWAAATAERLRAAELITLGVGRWVHRQCARGLLTWQVALLGAPTTTNDRYQERSSRQMRPPSHRHLTPASPPPPPPTETVTTTTTPRE